MAQLELEAETLRAGLGASRSVIVTRSIASSGPFWQSPGGACPRGVIELLRSTPAKDRVVRARWYEQRRAREAARARAHPVEPEDEEDEPPPLPNAADLKSLYRRLARRFHPDLARTEEEQVRHAEVMSRLNALSARRGLALVTLARADRRMVTVVSVVVRLFAFSFSA